jgi:hypothetical protein
LLNKKNPYYAEDEFMTENSRLSEVSTGDRLKDSTA